MTEEPQDQPNEKSDELGVSSEEPSSKEKLGEEDDEEKTLAENESAAEEILKIREEQKKYRVEKRKRAWEKFCTITRYKIESLSQQYVHKRYGFKNIHWRFHLQKQKYAEHYVKLVIAKELLYLSEPEALDVEWNENKTPDKYVEKVANRIETELRILKGLSQDAVETRALRKFGFGVDIA